MLCALRAHLASCTLLAGVVAPGVLGRDTGTLAAADGLPRLEPPLLLAWRLSRSLANASHARPHSPAPNTPTGRSHGGDR